MSEDNAGNHIRLASAEDEALAKDSASAQIDFDALGDGKKLYCSNGDGITEENCLAFKLFSQAAEAGHDAEAQYYLGLCYLNGDGVKEDEAKALMWLGQSASAGLEKAVYCLGNAGLEKAMYSLGVRYWIGKPFPKNDDEAIKWLQKASDAGLEAACVFLATIHKRRNDTTEELKWNKEAALRGCFDSLWTVRTFYERKDGVEMELVEGCAWLSLFEDTFTRRKLSRELWSFQLGSDVSEYKTSSSDLMAIMSAPEIERARQLYLDLTKQRVKWLGKKAEDASQDTAQFELGWCYREGYGVPQDNAQALAWYRYAASQGDVISQEEADKLAIPMSPMELERASQLYRELQSRRLGELAKQIVARHPPITEEELFGPHLYIETENGVIIS